MGKKVTAPASAYLLIIGLFSLAISLPIGINYIQKNEYSSLSLASSSMIHSELSAFERIDVKKKYGLNYNYYTLHKGVIQEGESLSVLLDRRYHVSRLEVEKLDKKGKELENAPVLNAGKSYTIFANPETGKAEYMIYEPSVYSYYKYNIKDSLSVEYHRKKVEKRQATHTGVITSSLWNTIVQSDRIHESMVQDMATSMEEAFQWSVNFHHVQKGDRFRLIYEEKWIEGKPVGVGRLLAAEFDLGDKSYHAIRYQSEAYDGFFDLEARPMVKTFLKAPVKYSRISSRYNLRRYHPVLKRRKAHLGTDFAAPRGTPIYATANGTISRKGRTRGNGNFIKIKHDNTYSTQYLHMNGFAKGMGVGVRVKQGDVIGYVGSTGLATGPHVCYRFWKNGKQVDPLRLNFPPPKPMNEKDKAIFMKKKESWKAQLDALAYPTIDETEKLSS